MTAAADPQISIVIPIYNEEAILHAAVVDLRERLSPFGWRYEIILAENGSRDRTIELCEELAARYPQVSFFSTGQPGQGNYGKALQRGILRARGEHVICDEIDLCDTDFYRHFRNRHHDCIKPRRTALVNRSRNSTSAIEATRVAR